MKTAAISRPALSQREVARVLKINQATVARIERRAMRKIRKAYEQMFGSIKPGDTRP